MKLGDLSAKYESNGNVGSISNTPGDRGGKSYGLYQLAIKTGSLEAYIKQSRFYSYFKWIKLGSDDFDGIWKKLASERPQEFADDQHEYIESVYYTPVRTYLTKQGIPDTTAINQVIWSTSVQHGPNWAKNNIKNLVGQSNESIIKTIYDRRGAQIRRIYKDKPNILNGVLNRYKQEEKDALALL